MTESRSIAVADPHPCAFMKLALRRETIVQVAAICITAVLSLAHLGARASDAVRPTITGIDDGDVLGKAGAATVDVDRVLQREPGSLLHQLAAGRHHRA